jgi:hypothetical protein
MRGKLIIICMLIALLLSSVGLTGKAHADAILFPWIVKGDTVSTFISVVNTAGPMVNGFGPGEYLHYQYWYKASTSNGDTEICTNQSFMRPTSRNDIVSFDASGIMNDGKALFNDSSPYGDLSFKLSASSPRRGFLIVDNNTPALAGSDQNIDGTLSGEALIIDHVVGMVWGYTAYNARFTGKMDNSYDQVYFNDGRDYQGEVIGATEAGRTVILPPSEYTTKFYVTPVGGQRSGAINTRVYLGYETEPGEFQGGMYLNDEEPIDFNKKMNVACTTALTLDKLIPEGAYYFFNTSGNQGWAYIKTEEGSLGDANIVKSSQAVIGKLEWKIFTQSVAIDLSDSTDCVSCKKSCLDLCTVKGKKPDFLCEANCAKKCKPLCFVNKSVETWPGNFNWIRSGESLPPPVFYFPIDNIEQSGI